MLKMSEHSNSSRDDENDEFPYLGKLLGRGSFSKCYEIELDSNKKFAAKIHRVNSLELKNRALREEEILRELSHPNIISFFFSQHCGNKFMLVLELCSNGSLLELLEERKTLTLPEVRYFMRQIVLAVNYMHDRQVIHRDLKPGNIFLDKSLNVKIGDFNLAARVEKDLDWNKTQCGTLNFIAPEILFRQKYDFKVDIWSIGCIMHFLIKGKPPFEKNSLSEKKVPWKIMRDIIRENIKNCNYKLPPSLDIITKFLLLKLLQKDPINRPSAHEVLKNKFFLKKYMPSYLPISCLTIEPSFTKRMTVRVKPIHARKNLTVCPPVPRHSTRENLRNSIYDPNLLSFYNLRSGIKRRNSTLPTFRKRQRTSKETGPLLPADG